MTKEEIIEFLYNKRILAKDRKRKIYNWKSKWDNECESVFNKFAQSYRSNDEAWFCLVHNIEPAICQVCGKLAKFTGSIKSKVLGYNTTCEYCSPNQVKEKNIIIQTKLKNRSFKDKEKSKIKRRKTCLEKYGDENFGLFGSKSFKDNLEKKYNNRNFNNPEKRRQTCLDKYGVDHNFKLFSGSDHSKRVWLEQRNSILNKRRSTCLEKYGCVEFVKTDEFKHKANESIINHFGSIENANRYKREKSKLTLKYKYNDETYHNKEQAKQTLENDHLQFEISNNCTRYTTIVEKFGQGWKSLNLPVIYNKRFRYISNEYLPQIEKYSNETHNLQSTSKQENELYEYIKTLTNYRIYRNNKSIIFDDKQKYELDIYIPKIKLAFEFNGSYWHSTIYKDKYYHQTKTKLCYNKGIQLIHIYEYEWITNKNEIKQRIKMLFDGINCSEFNWVSIDEYNDYTLTEPEEIQIGNLQIFNEGKFIHK